jgi:polyisoprenoid-binding protein YceI
MIRTAAAVVAFALCAPAAAQTTYTIDPRHTHVTWAVSHFGTSTFRGKLNKSSGKVILDPASGKGSIEVVFDTTGHVSGDDRLDKQLVSQDFFNVEKYTTARFVSNRIRYNGQAPALIEGELTIIGVTRPVTLTVTHFHCRQHPIHKKDFCGADAVTAIRRSDWGMKYGIPAVGDDVKLDIAIEAVKD